MKLQMVLFSLLSLTTTSPSFAEVITQEKNVTTYTVTFKDVKEVAVRSTRLFLNKFPCNYLDYQLRLQPVQSLYPWRQRIFAETSVMSTAMACGGAEPVEVTLKCKPVTIPANEDHEVKVTVMANDVDKLEFTPVSIGEPQH